MILFVYVIYTNHLIFIIHEKSEICSAIDCVAVMFLHAQFSNVFIALVPDNQLSAYLRFALNVYYTGIYTICLTGNIFQTSSSFCHCYL